MAVGAGGVLPPLPPPVHPASTSVMTRAEKSLPECFATAYPLLIFPVLRNCTSPIRREARTIPRHSRRGSWKISSLGVTCYQRGNKLVRIALVWPQVTVTEGQSTKSGGNLTHKLVFVQAMGPEHLSHAWNSNYLRIRLVSQYRHAPCPFSSIYLRHDPLGVGFDSAETSWPWRVASLISMSVRTAGDM